MWPVPDQTYYQFLTWSIKYPQDVSATYTQNPQIPRRYLPALISGLAVELAMKKAPDRINILKPLYDEDWSKAKDEAVHRAETAHFRNGFLYANADSTGIHLNLSYPYFKDPFKYYYKKHTANVSFTYHADEFANSRTEPLAHPNHLGR